MVKSVKLEKLYFFFQFKIFFWMNVRKKYTNVLQVSRVIPQTRFIIPTTIFDSRICIFKLCLRILSTKLRNYLYY